MTDIAKRLHGFTHDKDNCPRMDSERQVPVGLAREAAAEIERLTTALAEQTKQHEYPCSPHCAGYLREQAALAEIARLRDLLAFNGLDPDAVIESAKGAALEPKP